MGRHRAETRTTSRMKSFPRRKTSAALVHGWPTCAAVALLFFSLSFFIRGTQVLALLRGVAVVVISMVLLARVFELTALGVPIALVGLVVIYFANTSN